MTLGTLPSWDFETSGSGLWNELRVEGHYTAYRYSVQEEYKSIWGYDHWQYLKIKAQWLIVSEITSSPNTNPSFLSGWWLDSSEQLHIMIDPTHAEEVFQRFLEILDAPPETADYGTPSYDVTPTVDIPQLPTSPNDPVDPFVPIDGTVPVVTDPPITTNPPVEGGGTGGTISKSTSGIVLIGIAALGLLALFTMRKKK